MIDQDGSPWFVASDVCRTLGLNLCGGTGPHLVRLASDERMPIPIGLAKGKGGNQLTLISESGLYKLVMRSDKDSARAYQEWVTRDVLPAIRKDGAYINGEEKAAKRGC